jgi:hypothetical protein
MWPVLVQPLTDCKYLISVACILFMSLYQVHPFPFCDYYSCFHSPYFCEIFEDACFLCGEVTSLPAQPPGGPGTTFCLTPTP